MKDFTLSAFHLLLSSLQKSGYSFITFEDFLIQKPSGKYIILRHDVDALPENSLKTAIIENKLGIKGTYYFRIIKSCNDPEIIKSIAELGHEIGYHYEDLALSNGNREKAIASFKKNLAYFRTFYPVKTICMHGSPLSMWHNQTLWENYNYKDYGIIGTPYVDIDFNLILYLTDTGRRWNGKNVSIRDKVRSSYSFNFQTTFDIINTIGKLPDQLMITTHPQRWNDNLARWILELVSQNGKNLIKRLIAS